MEIEMDIFLKRGKNHQICEDYILQNDLFPSVILSDGCTSSSKTDVGARILANAANSYITKYCFHNRSELWYQEAGEWIIHRAYAIAELMGLPYYVLDATLTMAYRVKDIINIHMYGDGYIILVDWDNNIKIIEVNYEPNFPYYLSYLLDPSRKLDYMEKGIRKITTVDLESWDMPYSAPTKYQYSLKNYPTILIASDGLGTFNFEATIVWDIMKELVKFKTSNVKTRFLYKRAKKLFVQYEKDGFTHHDDIAIGGFRVRGDKDEILYQREKINKVGSE